jgi:hypothetical protein
MELVGYDKPKMDLPDYVTWISLGEQRGPKFYSDDLCKYFSAQPEYFMYIMEDCFIKSFDGPAFDLVCDSLDGKIDKYCLTNEAMRREHKVEGSLFIIDQNAKYRLSMQPAIWRRDFFCSYLTPGLDPWQVETQPQQNDGSLIIGSVSSIMYVNEGVRRHDIYNLNLDGIKL